MTRQTLIDKRRDERIVSRLVNGYCLVRVDGCVLLCSDTLLKNVSEVKGDFAQVCDYQYNVMQDNI